MIAALKAASDIVKLALGALLGLLIGWAATFGYVSWFTIPSERQEAAEVRDRAWEKREAEAAEKREHERAVTQTRIDRIESEYHQRDQARQADMAELERALAEAETDVPIPTASLGAPPVCRPAVLPRSLSDALGRIGRAAPRDGVAVPQTPLR